VVYAPQKSQRPNRDLFEQAESEERIGNKEWAKELRLDSISMLGDAVRTSRSLIANLEITLAGLALIPITFGAAIWIKRGFGSP
jgi:hypothetical protein